jgi:hypothetical protein
VGAVKVGAAVLVDKIIGLAIRGEMGGVPLLLEIMPEMEAAGCVPEPFTAYNKEEIRGTTSDSTERGWSWILDRRFQVLGTTY